MERLEIRFSSGVCDRADTTRTVDSAHIDIQRAITEFELFLKGAGFSCHLVERSMEAARTVIHLVQNGRANEAVRS